MDGKRFDRLARQWSISSSRRLMVRAVGAATLGGMLPKFASDEVPIGITLVRGQALTAAGCRVKTVKLWINAFLPSEVLNADGSLYTSEVPDGPHQGETMVPGPSSLNDCFLTDQRLFSDAIAASSRMHSEITINTKSGKVVGQKHRCSPTHEIDCEDGAVECETIGTIKGRRFYDFRATGGREFTVFLRARASNPCFSGSPDIDYEGRFRIELNGKKNKATVSFKGKVDKFPAFEAYASVNGGAPKPLIQVEPAPGATPADLPGRASVSVSGSAVLSGPCACPPELYHCGHIVPGHTSCCKGEKPCRRDDVDECCPGETVWCHNREECGRPGDGNGPCCLWVGEKICGPDGCTPPHRPCTFPG